MRCRVAGCINDSGMRPVCRWCWAGRSALLRDLPERWVRLRGQLAKGGSGPAEALSRPRPGSRPPLQVHILDTLVAVPAHLAEWANRALAIEGRDGALDTTTCRDGYLMSAACSVLTACDSSLADGPDAVAYLHTLVSCYRRMTILIGLEPTVTRLSAPCPACEQTIVPLYRDAGREVVTCTVCASTSPDAVWIGRLLTTATLVGPH